MSPSYKLQWATLDDDKRLRDCLNKTPIPGKISLLYKRDPSFYTTLKAMGESNKVLCCRLRDEIVGLGILSYYKAFYKGTISQIGYLNSLRIQSDHQKLGLLARGYKLIQEAMNEDQKTLFYLSTIISDNKTAIKILTHKRLTLPHYIDVGCYSTYALEFSQKKKELSSLFSFKKASSQEDFAEVVAFLQKTGKEQQLFPFYTVDSLNELPCFHFKETYMALDVSTKKIVAVFNVWDQGAMKQTVVASYDKLTSYLRPFYNPLAKILGRVTLPQVGELFKYPFLSMMAVQNNDPTLFAQLLAFFQNEYRSRGYHYFVVGLHEKDPLCKGLNIFRSYRYDARIYYVSYKPEEDHIRQLQKSFFYLEAGRL